MFQGTINRLSRIRWRQYTMIAWMPFSLALLLVWQSQLFNQWSGLGSFYPVTRSVSTFGTGILLFGPAVFFPRTRRHLYLAVISLIISLIFMAQFLYFSYSGSFLQASALRYASQTTALGGVIKAYAGPELLFFGVSLSVIALGYWLVRHKGQQYNLKLKECLVAAGTILLVFAICQGYLVKREYDRWGNAIRLYENFFDNSDVVRKMGVINYSLIDSIRQAFRHRGVSTEEVDLVKNWVANREEVGTKERAFGVAKGRNLIFIQLESYESFLLGSSIEGQEISPNLNSLARQGLNFTNYYYHVGPGATADAEFQILNSLYAPMNEVPFFEYPHHDYDSLAEHLKNNGYQQTAVFHGDFKTFWNRNAIYPQLAIDQFVDVEDYQVPRQVVWGLSDRDFFRQTVPKLLRLPQPFFAYLIALTSHTPFNLPDDLKTLKITERHGISDFQISYLHTAHYVDEAVGQLINDLQRAGLYKNSLIVIYGDHTSQIAPQHDDAFARFLGLDQFDDQTYLRHLRGPLIILAPGAELSGEVTAPGTHIDLYPTVTSLLGVGTPRTVMGQDLLNPKNPVAVRRSSSAGIFSLVAEDYVYFSSGDGVFENGRCLKTNDNSKVDTSRCLPIYKEHALRIRISDIVLRGNLVHLLR